MKIKKKTSLMMVAASTAAIVGIAAVSFAAWQGGNSVNVTSADALTGNVNYIGFTAETPSMAFDKNIVPYDQGTVSGDNATMVSAAIPEYIVSSDYQIKVESDVELSFYYQIVDTDATAPTLPTAETLSTSDWKAVGASSAQTVTGVTAKVTKNQTVYLILDSDNETQMNTQYHITVTLTLV